ncbi:MAG TPA: MoaD/ThiS family protein [Hanamia sp.]
MEIILFGQLRDIAGSNRISIDAIKDTNDLKKELHSKYPGFDNAKYAIAVDKKIISETVPLNTESEIALLPPFSGG